MESLRVLLVEDQTVVREGLRQLVESEPGLTVAGEAATVAEAVALGARLQPDVVLLDLKLPDGSGLDAARQLLAGQDPPAALALGVSGYIPKSASFQEIVAAVRAAAAGGVVLHPSLAGKVAQGGDRELTGQELQMLRLLADGASYGEIGTQVFLSERTVRRHMNTLFAKLGCASRAAAVAEGVRRGLLS